VGNILLWIYRSLLQIPLIFINIGVSIMQSLNLNNVIIFSTIYNKLIYLQDYIMNF